jgi:hypothetical protein
VADDLRARIAEALLTTPAGFMQAEPDGVEQHARREWHRHDRHRYHATCALCRGEEDTLTDAVMKVVQAELDLADDAWGSVWLHGKWSWLTKNMTTLQREYAADCVARWDARLAEIDGEPGRGEPEGLRWWREPEPPTGLRGLLEHVGIDTRGKTITVDGKPIDEPSPPPSGAAVCERCHQWEATPGQHPLCPSCGRPWGTLFPHACDNCEGVDPDTCLNNPDRSKETRS